MLKCKCVCVCVYNLLSLEILELGTTTGQLFWHLLLSQLLHLCLQGSQLLLQSLRETKTASDKSSEWDKMNNIRTLKCAKQGW